MENNDTARQSHEDAGLMQEAASQYRAEKVTQASDSCPSIQYSKHVHRYLEMLPGSLPPAFSRRIA